MTIDKAIAHAREVAKQKYAEGMLCHANPNDYKLDGCIKCAEEHEQLAEWLEELKALRILSMMTTTNDFIARQVGYEAGYHKAIDDFVEKIQWEYLNGCGIKQSEIEFLIAVSSQVAEQLKAGD